MKKILLLGLAFLLFIPSGAALDRQPLAEADDFSIRLLSYQRMDGQIDLTLQCRNETDEALKLILFAPMANDLPASFLYGWGTQDLALQPGDQQCIISLYTDDPGEWIHTCSFRIIRGAAVSGPMQLDLRGNTARMMPANWAWMDQEAPLIGQSAVPLSPACPDQPLLFSDALTQAQLKKLDYGLLQLCIRTEFSGEECLMPFASVPVFAAEDGSIQALYSGNALICTLAPQFPLQTREMHENGMCHYEMTDMALAGPFIFFAGLSLSLDHSPGMNAAAVTGSCIDGVETGILFQNLPLALMDWAQASHLLIAPVSGQDGAVRMESLDAVSFDADVQMPLSFQLVPAESLGEIYGYFEYFFTDQTDVIHPPFPVFPEKE